MNALNMTFKNPALMKELCAEIKKEDRRLLYDRNKAGYKNNKLKQAVWSEIAESLQMQRHEVQTLWKRAKIKYKETLQKLNGPNDSGKTTLKPVEGFLLKEMEFLKDFIEDDTPKPVYNYQITEVEETTQNDYTDPLQDDNESTSSKEQQPVSKRIKYNDEITESLDRLEKLAYKISKTPPDAFYACLEAEMAKLPPEVNIELKASFMKQIYEAQKRNMKLK